MAAKTRLQEFERALAAARDEDIGNALFDSLEKVCIDLDGAEFAQAILILDMADLAPGLLIWREKLIAAILEEVNADT
jgi:hypothetical protein